MKKIQALITLLITVMIPAISLTYPEETQRSSINSAKDTETTLEFFMEKQFYDPSLSQTIEFYPLDSWYFESFLKKHKELSLANPRLLNRDEDTTTPEEAYLWYLDIANGENSKYSDFSTYAQYIIALCLKNQEGTIKSYSLARKYISQSFSAGFAGSYYLMGIQKEDGWSVKGTDNHKEEELYGIAASQNFPEALLKFASLYKSYSDTNALNLLQRDMKYNDSRAYLLSGSNKDLEQAVKLGNSTACMALAQQYSDKKNYQTAINYYTLAATFGECEGFNQVARIYREGLADSKDPELAAFYYQQYRDAKYEKEASDAMKVQVLRDFYETDRNEPDETICRDLGIYYYIYPAENSTISGTEWFSKGVGKGSAECSLQLAMRHKKNAEGLVLYKQAVAESNAFPLGTKQQEKAYGQLDDIYAQVLQATRFKNDVDYWLNPSEPKRETIINKTAAQASTKKEALAWFKNRSANGNSFQKTWYAWILLEDMNAEAYGMPAISKKADKDVKEAYAIASEVVAHDSDYAPALVCLARCYENGYGSKKKTKEAKNLLQKAISLNYSEAYGFLAKMTTDKKENFEFLDAGCRNLDEYSLYLAYQDLIWTSGITDLQQLIEAASKYGYTPAFMQTVDCYIRETAVTFDKTYDKIDKAHSLAYRSEALNITDARSKRLYIERNFTNKMQRTSYTCSQKIAEAREIVQKNRSPETIYNLALAYEEAHDILDNTDAQAARYYLQSAEQGNINAMKKIASLYYSGRGIAPSYEKAFHWYSVALENGSNDVFAELGAMYLDGKGCEREVELGIECYRRAVAQDPESWVKDELNYFDGI